ncbi:uncharacterized protein LOC112559532 isoform X2 [Pomacea canaliculata]|uniref:uncharacterized protein LOC112559532 isoform X2 n=1 Tax=Pomacea canaliculata TaxID=400727 RepID=UPI000D729380|nr:uncharacterized protein LOC112559532 isoform X2 [Pomacea canaliculata]
MAQVRGQRGQNPDHKEKSVKVNQVRSMLALLSRSREEPSNVVEVSTESPHVAEMDWSGEVETGGNRGLVADEAGGAGQHLASWNSSVLRELSQVLDQSDVLKGMWNNHKMQLAEVLASRDREAARAGRLEQGLARARHMIQSLRCQRRQTHQYLEQKEEEWATALRCHRNEATFLRRKILVGLEEKKHLIADPKKDGRLAAILDSLLALHMEREHFLALDLAKQNKINELKLLAIRQQLSMEELKERNMELTNALSLLLQCLPHTGPGIRLPSPSNPRFASSSTSRGVSGGGSWGSSSYRGSDLTDLLYCDRAVYLPRQSTCPDLVAIRVYSVGDGDHHHTDQHHHNIHHDQTGHDRSLAEDLLRELSLYGPGSPNFTLADVQ